MAVRLSHPPKGCIFHGDPRFRKDDSQYCAYDYQKKLQAYGLLPSMSGKANCYDNASHAVRLKPLSSGTSTGSITHEGATHT
jgi:putative transposase